MLSLFHFRLLNLFIFLGCIALLGLATLVEPFKSMNPCPMCMMQRAVFAAIALISLLAFAHNPAHWGRTVYGTFSAITAAIGAAIASRQLWLQSLPEDQVPACGPGLEYMLEVFPLLEVIEMSLVGTGDCAEVQWTLAGISIPGWSLLAFVAIALAQVLALILRAQGKLK